MANSFEHEHLTPEPRADHPDVRQRGLAGEFVRRVFEGRFKKMIKENSGVELEVEPFSFSNHILRPLEKLREAEEQEIMRENVNLDVMERAKIAHAEGDKTEKQFKDMVATLQNIFFENQRDLEVVKSELPEELRRAGGIPQTEHKILINSNIDAWVSKFDELRRRGLGEVDDLYFSNDAMAASRYADSRVGWYLKLNGVDFVFLINSEEEEEKTAQQSNDKIENDQTKLAKAA